MSLTTPNKYLTVACLGAVLFQVFVFCASVQTINGLATSERESPLIKENLGRASINANSNDQDEEEENEGEDGEYSPVSTGNRKVATRKFGSSMHQQDHSFYAHRSLMSTAGIQHHENDKSHDADDYEPLRTADFVEKEWQLMFRSFDMSNEGLSSTILRKIGEETSLFQDILSKLPSECRRSIEHARDSMRQQKLWALRMVDSLGKIPSGVTYGRFASPGDYSECLAVQVDETIDVPGESGNSFRPEHHKFHGKYCLLDFRLPLPERPAEKLLSVHDPVIDLSETELGRAFPSMKNYTGYASLLYEVGYVHGFCFPSTCDAMDVAKAIGHAIEGLHIIVNSTIDCQEANPDQSESMRISQIIALIFLICVLTNATLASVAHYMRSRNTQSRRRNGRQDADNDRTKLKAEEAQRSSRGGLASKFKQWIAANSSAYADCFSLQTNFERLTKPDPRGLTFVHYTRIVAMALTVITHTGGMGTLQDLTKPADTSNSAAIFRDFIPQMLANAFTSIQVFFFMAGFMLVVSTYPSLNRERGHISFLEYAVKRAIRLMPGLAATICINFLWPLIVSGPLLSYFVRLIVIPCEITWWRTMAFLSNFDHVEKMCLRHSYFSASDYQLHIMAFPLLILLYKQPGAALLIAGLLTVAGFVAQVIMVLTKPVLPFMMIDYLDKEAFFNVIHYTHHPVWNHASAFFYGFIIGYLVVKQVRINLSPRTTKWLWWTIMPAGILALFAPYFWNHYRRPIYRWQMILYVLFDRFILLTSCAWLSYGTMVLGRPPPPAAKKRSVQQQPPLLNLPNIVALEQQQDKTATGNNGSRAGAISAPPLETQALQLSSGISQSLSTSDASFVKTTQSGQLSATNEPMSSMTRQRSTPDFLCLKGNEDTKVRGDEESSVSQPKLRLVVSTNNVSANVGTARQAEVVDVPLQGQPNNGPSVPQATKAPQRRASVVVSNLNTLCLMLSRLTFQLYLFNMVVLWIDVNHSRYNWFMSYYFIIVKAAAVYMLSALFATVFFITMESPCLSLYIRWVKGRAEKRAKRRAEVELKSSDNNKNNNFNGLSMRMNSINTKIE